MRTKSLSDETIGYSVGIIVFIFLGYVIYSFIFHKKRKEVMSNYCQQNGLKYTETSEQILDCNEQFDMILRGKDQCLDHIISGTRGDYEFQIFDFSTCLRCLSFQFSDSVFKSNWSIWRRIVSFFSHVFIVYDIKLHFYVYVFFTKSQVIFIHIFNFCIYREN